MDFAANRTITTRNWVRSRRLTMPLALPLFGLALGVYLIGWPSPGLSQAESKVDFARDIQPIFERNCLACHGPDQQLGSLRLDAKAVVFRGGASGKVVVPHNAANSELYRRVAGIGDQPRMPMGSELPAAEIELIRRWIDQGAPWPEQLGAAVEQIEKPWAYVKPQRPPLPKVSNPDWPVNPIDYFVLARLDKEGLAPSPKADRVTLLRRLSLDLIGLPPTIKEVDAFLADTSDGAYDKQVERLLSSPHYGERWGRQWLDAARYADSDGFEKDKPRFVWFYRDWVVNAFNRDLPYDRFIIEQIAGDLLPNATQDQLVATGFLRNSMINEEGGIDPEQFRMEAMFDRMDAIGKSVLGITIQCAQCHNHKYDPLKQEDYYRMFAFLNNSNEANIAVYTRQQQIERAEVFSEIRGLETRLQKQHPDWRQRMAAWEQQVKNDQPEWIVVRPAVDDISTGGSRYLPLDDGSFLQQGYAPTKHRVKMTAETDVQNITGFRLELMNDPNLPLNGPGRSIKGTGALSEFEVEAAPTNDPDSAQFVAFSKATADINLPEKPLDPMFYDKSTDYRVTGPIALAIDGCNETAWGFDAGPGRRNQPRQAVFAAQEPIANPNGTILTFYLSQMHGGWNSDDNQNNNLGRFRLSITTSPDPVADPLPQRVRDILAIPRNERTPEQVQTVFSYWRTTVPEWNDVNAKIDQLWAQHPEPGSQLVLDERRQMRQTHILERGDFLKPKQAVEPGVPASLHPLPSGAPPNRLSFARWLVDRDSPTTARAMMNRLWQTYFGRGLVISAEDLGAQSEPPSHPALLDWLAVDFMDHDWRLKAMHRLIVTSATYRQSSRVTPELYQRDPYNRLLARGPRFRMEAEVVRDIALAASGLLSREMGGPPVHPPAPEFLFKPPVSYGPKVWNTETGSDRYRRSIYTFRFRSVPYPVLQTFDAPNGNAAVVRRERSNTPLQALTTLNEQLFMESARALALKTLDEGGATDADRLTYAFRRCLTRNPTAPESVELLALLDKQQARFASGELNPWELAANNPEQPPPLPAGATPTQLAAWTAVSRVLLNLDETITKE